MSGIVWSVIALKTTSSVESLVKTEAKKLLRCSAISPSSVIRVSFFFKGPTFTLFDFFELM